MKPSLYLAYAFFRGNSNTGIISVLSFLSIAGISLGVSSLIVATSIMNGFAKELKNVVMELSPHIEITSLISGHQTEDWEQLASAISNKVDLRAQTPFVRGESMLRFRSATQGSMVLGVTGEAMQDGFELPQKITHGELLGDEPFSVLVGEPLLSFLGATVTDQLLLLSASTTQTVFGFIPRLKTITVDGTYRSGLYSVDTTLVFMDLASATRLFSKNGSYDGLMLWIADPFQAPHIAQQLRESLPHEYWIQDWTNRNSNIFEALALERKVMSIILIVIIVLATFNVSIVLYQLVRDKRETIAVLRTMGATPKFIAAIFLQYGLILILLGISIGMFLGLGIAYFIPDMIAFLEQLFQFQLLRSSVFIITTIPSEIKFADTAAIIGTTAIIAWLFLLHPAYRAALIKPHEILKYE